MSSLPQWGRRPGFAILWESCPINVPRELPVARNPHPVASALRIAAFRTSPLLFLISLVHVCMVCHNVIRCIGNVHMYYSSFTHHRESGKVVSPTRVTDTCSWERNDFDRKVWRSIKCVWPQNSDRTTQWVINSILKYISEIYSWFHKYIEAELKTEIRKRNIFRIAIIHKFYVNKYNNLFLTK